MPSFIISIITMIAVVLNDKFLWNLNPTQLIASITLAVNFVGVSIWKDIVILKNGGKPTINSTKLVATLFALLIIGFSDYVGIELDTESVWWVAGIAAAFVTGKGVQDWIEMKKGGAINEPTQHNSDRGPAI
jgi:hypothetical protein